MIMNYARLPVRERDIPSGQSRDVVLSDNSTAGSWSVTLPRSVTIGPDDPTVFRFFHIDPDIVVGNQWLQPALREIEKITSGKPYQYARIALERASEANAPAPTVYKSPDGGVVIEHRNGDRRLSLIIEDKLGVLVGSSTATQANVTVEINPRSINELLARYVQEIRLAKAKE